MELEGRVMLVAGGAGRVGTGITRALLRQGATVVVPSRRADALARLREATTTSGGTLLTVEGDVGRPDGAERVRGQVAERAGALDGVVAAVGGWWQGPVLWEASADELSRVAAANVLTHFVIARTFLPQLLDRPGASYAFISGSAAEEPTPKAGFSSITGAAVVMLMRTLAAEARGRAVRINLLMLGAVAPAGAASPSAQLTAGEVGDTVAWLASDRGRMVSGAILRLFERPPPATPL